MMVLGAGKSGIGAAILAKKNNIDVVVCDDSNISNKNIEILNNHNIKWYENEYMSSFSNSSYSRPKFIF